MPLSSLSKRRLAGVHEDLVKVVLAADGRGVPFQVVEGLRSQERQEQLFKEGKTKVKNGGRHTTGHAVDLVVVEQGVPMWDWPAYRTLAAVMKLAAEEQKVPITWGGDWGSFPDGPHFELPRSVYPAKS